jgi:hypothetical protein
MCKACFNCGVIANLGDNLCTRLGVFIWHHYSISEGCCLGQLILGLMEETYAKKGSLYPD